jgi:hypothetical protein
VRTLGLNSISEWIAYGRSGQKPDDIPAYPNNTYSEWINWADWLGNGKTPRPEWRPFGEARTFARSLRLRSVTAWRDWCKSGQKPDDIPSAPWDIYSERWSCMYDWLGSGRRASGWRTFEEARTFVR